MTLVKNQQKRELIMKVYYENKDNKIHFTLASGMALLH